MTSAPHLHLRESADPGLAAVASLPGVGPALEATLARLGILRIQDLWFHLPLRYEDRTRITAIRDLRAADSVQVEGTVEAVEQGFRFRPQLRVVITDDARSMLTLRFFSFRRTQVQQLAPGTRLRCYGQVRYGAHGFEMVHPQYQRVLADGSGVDECLTPVYPTTEGLGQKRLAVLIAKALLQLPPAAQLEQIPAPLLEPLRLQSLRDALLQVHRPAADADVAALLQGIHPSQRRLAFEELLAHHLGMKRLRARIRSHRAPGLAGTGEAQRDLLAALPFKLTGAQQRVAREIARDMSRSEPMLRLVHGDVGSGKTVVAALAALVAIESGFQVALMAPTELLAEQHLRNFRDWLAPLGIEPVWLAGKVQGKARQAAMTALQGPAQLVIGTHALMQDAVAFRKLGLVIIDEQHRFGVHQRLALRDKGADAELVPHQLVLTATPIPRTLAMTAYADLDVSRIDELPPGRSPVTTVAISTARRAEVVDRIRAACGEGRQAYWVCTLIEDSEQLEAQAAETTHAELERTLQGISIGLIHGRMKPAEKQKVMQQFQSGAISVLVATTVIEVGVDVPNASLMIMENAERLGLAQLHQLRGRVGRGSLASSCVLLYQPPLSAMARERLNALRETNDGFEIAEKDLKLRGPGELLGTRQTGRLEFRIANLTRDAAMLAEVQDVAGTMLRKHAGACDRLIARWVGNSARFADA